MAFLQADHIFDFHSSSIVGLTLLPRNTPSSTLFVTAAADGVLRVWDYAKRRLVFKKEFVKLPRVASVEGARSVAPEEDFGRLFDEDTEAEALNR